MTNYDVVKKLIGDVRPKGDASRDYQILENLKALIELHAEIHKAIDDVAYDFKDDKQGSVKMCCDEANKYLYSLGIADYPYL
jgi:hypothetical protein